MRKLSRSLVAFLAALAAGCGGPAVCELSGTVTFDGQPVQQGGITFAPRDGKSPTAGAMVKDGRYACTLPPGDYKVVINGSKKSDRKPHEGEGPSGGMTAELLPAKYNQNSDLTFDARAGKQEKNWELVK